MSKRARQRIASDNWAMAEALHFERGNSRSDDDDTFDYAYMPEQTEQAKQQEGRAADERSH